jgi:carbonic anhydrase/acetyltransferase-like protein (isoleucine patch superfamily)
MLAKLHVGRNTTIGSNCTLYSCHIGDDVVIGDGCVILEGAKIENGA